MRRAASLAAAAAFLACQVAGGGGDREAPRASFVAYPASGPAPLAVRLDGSDSADNVAVVDWRWDFGDGSQGRGKIVDHRYAARGSYQATLTAFDAAGNQGSAAHAIEATAPADEVPPRASLSAAPLAGVAPLTVHFDSSGSSDDVGITSRALDFGDGQQASGALLDHVYASAGAFTATLTVSDAAGNQATATASIAVAAPAVDGTPPTAVLRLSPQFGSAPLTVHADGSGSSDDVAVTAWHLDLGDGRSADAAVQDVVYPVAGRYRLALTVRDAAGNAATVAETVEVDPPPAQVDQHVYSDAVIAPWQDWSWATSYDLAAAPAHTGAHSIRLSLQGFEGLHFHDPQGLDLTGFDRLSFWVDGGAAGGQKLLAALHTQAGPTPSLDVTPFVAGGAIPRSGWAQVVIPLSAFTLGGHTIDGVILQDGSGTSQPDVWIDDLGIFAQLGAEQPLPCPPLPASPGFVTRSGAALLLGGRGWRGAGADLYYLQPDLARAQQLGDAASLRAAREALDDVVCLGLPVVRTFAFNEHAAADDVGSIEPAPGVYREEGLAALDQVVAEAKARGLRLVVGLANNWAAYGGLPQYAAWAGKQHDDFFTDARMKGWWKSYASMLLARVNTFTGVAYRDEPTILAWEIANELRCSSCAGSLKLPDAVGELAAHLRSVAPRQLVADGGEGFDSDPSLYPSITNQYPVAGSEGASFSRLGGIAELDLLSAHFYPVNWNLDLDGDAAVWIDRHQAIAASAGKVFYLGEYGYAAADAARAPVYDRWESRLYQAAGGSLGLVWQVTPTGMSDAEGFAVHYPGDAATTAVLSKWALSLH